MRAIWRCWGPRFRRGIYLGAHHIISSSSLGVYLLYNIPPYPPSSCILPFPSLPSLSCPSFPSLYFVYPIRPPTSLPNANISPTNNKRILGQILKKALWRVLVHVKVQSAHGGHEVRRHEQAEGGDTAGGPRTHSDEYCNWMS